MPLACVAGAFLSIRSCSSLDSTNRGVSWGPKCKLTCLKSFQLAVFTLASSVGQIISVLDFYPKLYVIVSLRYRMLSNSKSDSVFRLFRSFQTARHCYSRESFNHCLCYCVGYCSFSVTCLQFCRTERNAGVHTSNCGSG